MKGCLGDVVAILSQAFGIAEHRFGSTGLVKLDQCRIGKIILGKNGRKQPLAEPEAGELRFDRPEMSTYIEAIRFSWLGHQVADVEPRCATALNR